MRPWESFFPLKCSSPTPQAPWERYSIRSCSTAEPMSPPTLLSGSLSATLPSGTSTEGLKRCPRPPCVWLHNSGTWAKVQVPVESCVARRDLPPRPQGPLEGNPGPVTVLTLQCSGDGAPGRGGGTPLGLMHPALPRSASPASEAASSCPWSTRTTCHVALRTTRACDQRASPSAKPRRTPSFLDFRSY